MKETSWVAKLIDNTPLAIIAIGLLLFVVGAASGWPSLGLRVEGGWQVALAIMGVITSGMGAILIWRDRSPGKIEETLRKDFGIKITYPEEKDDVADKVEVRGSFEKKPPEDVDLVVIDFSTRSRLSYPKKVALLDEKRKSWRASVNVGGNPGDERIIQVAIMGKGGQALWNYFENVSSQINEIREKLNKQGVQVPSELYARGVRDLPPDIFVCDQVRVRRS